MIIILDKTNAMANMEILKKACSDIEEQFIDDFFGLTPMGGTIRKGLSHAISWRDSFYITKWRMFVEGVYMDDDAKAKIAEYFVTQEDKKEFLCKILKVLDDIDSDEKVKYLVNLTRSFLNNFINKDDYYRMVNCLRVVLVQDLKFLQENISSNYLLNNPNVDALVQASLMYQDYISQSDPNEATRYKFTALGEMLDRYSISFGDETKYKDYGKREDLSCTSHQTIIYGLRYREVEP